MEIKEKYTISKINIDPESNLCMHYYLLRCDDTPEYVIGVEIINGHVTDISLSHVVKFDSLDGNTYDVYEKISKNFYIYSLAQDLYSLYQSITATSFEMELIELMYNSDTDEVFLNGVRCIPKE